MKEKINLEIEKEPKYETLGKVSIMRHGETEYTDQYPDITELGQEQVSEQAERLAENINPNKEDILIASSPRVRAKGSADILKSRLKIKDEDEIEVKILPSLRGVNVKDKNKAEKIVDEIIGPERDISKFDKAWAKGNVVKENPDVWESQEKIDKRFFRGMECLIRAFTKYKESHHNKIPHLIAVSHFEFLNPLIMEVFGLTPDKDEMLKSGELIEMDFLNKGAETNKKEVSVILAFRGITKEVIFDRETKRFKVV